MIHDDDHGQHKLNVIHDVDADNNIVLVPGGGIIGYGRYASAIDTADITTVVVY